MTKKISPLGIRNNNPLNLVHAPANKWQGLAEPPSAGRFCVFTTPVFGIRAACVNLIAYQDRHGLRTIKDLIGRWAPHTENDVAAYVKSVRTRTGIPAEQIVDLHRYEDLRPIVEAMIWHENGQQPYTDAQLDKAIALAGVQREAPKSLQAHRTIKGSQVTAGATALGLAAEAVRQAEPALPLIQTALQYAPWVVGMVALAGIAWIVWAKIDDRRKGVA